MACSGRADLMLQGQGHIMRLLDTPGCRHDHLHLHTRHASLSSITMGATHRGSGKFSACYLVCAPQHPWMSHGILDPVPSILRMRRWQHA